MYVCIYVYIPMLYVECCYMLLVSNANQCLYFEGTPRHL